MHNHFYTLCGIVFFASDRLANKAVSSGIPREKAPRLPVNERKLMDAFAEGLWMTNIQTLAPLPLPVLASSRQRTAFRQDA